MYFMNLKVFDLILAIKPQLVLIVQIVLNSSMLHCGSKINHIFEVINAWFHTDNEEQMYIPVCTWGNHCSFLLPLIRIEKAFEHMLPLISQALHPGECYWKTCACSLNCDIPSHKSHPSSNWSPAWTQSPLMLVLFSWVEWLISSLTSFFPQWAMFGS